MIKAIESKLTEEFPNFDFSVRKVDEQSKYEIVEVDFFDTDHTIIFRQIVSGGDWDGLTEEEAALNSAEIVERSIMCYEKLDKEEIKRHEHKMIKVLNQMEPVSFHKLTEEELLERMERYEITEKDFKKKED